MKNSTTGKRAAMMVAYEAIKELGYTHARLVKENLGVNNNTLRNVRDGKTMKPRTIDFYIALFVSLLEKEYQNSNNEADTAKMNTILRIMRKILLLEHEKLSIPS